MALTHVLGGKNRIDDLEHWPASIKTTMQWFLFIEMTEYTGNGIKMILL